MNLFEIEQLITRCEALNNNERNQLKEQLENVLELIDSNRQLSMKLKDLPLKQGVVEILEKVDSNINRLI